MAVEFLSDEQAEAYGKFAEEPTKPELERFFFLDDAVLDAAWKQMAERLEEAGADAKISVEALSPDSGPASMECGTGITPGGSQGVSRRSR
ncbi:hypothetical protein [Kitasatospora sp. NPDC087315]|uniref:hypothetical protein n=1 Tax=Kitasatospora sp. NPDC087315 TaxID=3364069 RepID=UPI0037FEB4DB